MSARLLAVVGGLAAALASVAGAVFWQQEADYAATHRDSELATTLEKVGMGLVALGFAGVLLAIAVFQVSSKE